MNALYFKVLESVIILQEENNILVSKILQKKNDQIRRECRDNYSKYYFTISGYRGENSSSKFIFSQINEYYKLFSVFGNITYYKYIKAKDLYVNMNLIRYKYFEFWNGLYQNDKEVLHYVFLFQFLDFIISRGKLVMEPSAVFDTAYLLFPGFLSKLSKTEYLTKYRPIYFYSSLINIELTNNIGISKYFTDYPYSVRFLVYRISKMVKSYENITSSDIISIIEREIEDRVNNKIGAKFRVGGAEHTTLVNNILNAISENIIVSEDDKKTLGSIKSNGDGEDIASVEELFYGHNTLFNPYDSIDSVVEAYFSQSDIIEGVGDLSKRDYIEGLIIVSLYHRLDISKFKMINNVMNGRENLAFDGMINMIRVKSGIGINKDRKIKSNTKPNQYIVDNNNRAIKK